MKPNVTMIIAGIFIFLLVTIFCASFSASLAQLKGRSRKWGFIGFIFGIIGLIIVCFLPSKRDDGVQTNPIRHVISRMPSLSRKTIAVIAALAGVALITLVLYDVLPTVIQNYRYEQQITKENMNTAQPKQIATAVSDIFAGNESSFVIAENGSVYCFGRRLPKAIAEGSAIIYEHASKIASTESVCYVLTKDGHLYGMGDNSMLQLPGVVGSTEEFVLIAENVVDFSLSETTAGFIKTDGKLYMYGDGAHGQLGLSSNLDSAEPVAALGDVTKVICEATYTLALQKSGEAVVFGANDFGQMANAEPMLNHPVTVMSGVQKIAGGDGFIMLLDSAGTLFTCGANDCGQLGNGTNENGAQFTQILTGVTDIAAAKKSAFAILATGELYSWGQNAVGQLGCGSLVNQNLPVKTATDVVSVRTSGLHTVIFTKNGQVLSTGFNNCGQLGNGKARDGFSTLVNIKK